MSGHPHRDTREGTNAKIQRRQRALRYLVEACDLLGDAHRSRSHEFTFTTLNEEKAISDLRLRLKEWDDRG